MSIRVSLNANLESTYRNNRYGALPLKWPVIQGREGEGRGCFGGSCFNTEVIPLPRALVGGSTNSATANTFISIMRYVR